jgi:hypothetical protein
MANYELIALNEGPKRLLAPTASDTGTLAGGLTVTGAVKSTTNDGSALGASGTGWADLFLASGGVINWNAGNVTLTHSAGALNFGTANLTTTGTAATGALTVTGSASTTTGVTLASASGNVGIGIAHGSALGKAHIVGPAGGTSLFVGDATNSSLYITHTGGGATNFKNGGNTTWLTEAGGGVTFPGTVATGALTVTGNATLPSGNLIVSTETTPASAAATGTKGTVAWDASYVYVCTATDTWKRAAIATW